MIKDNEPFVILQEETRSDDAALDEREKLAKQKLNDMFHGQQVNKILFIAPPDVDVNLFDFHTAKRKRYWSYAPYGLGVMATFLKQEGVEVKIVNLNHEILKACGLSETEDQFSFEDTWKSVLSQEISSFKPDLIGVTCMFSQTHSICAKVCDYIKNLNLTIPLCLGGVHITNSFSEPTTKKQMIEDFSRVDFFFLYEGELAFRNFIQIINHKKTVQELTQIFLNCSDEKLQFDRKSIPTAEDLNVIPAHDLFKLEELSDYGKIGSFFCFKDPETKFATILSNRGCRAHCAFCSVRNFNGISVRSRSVRSVVEELILLRDKYGIGHVMWLDDDFLFNPLRIIDLFNEMIKQNVGITWDCTNGVIAASCTEEVIAAAVRSGCIGLVIGMESGNPEILRKINKPGTVDIFLRAAAVLRKYEQINARVFLMIGFPNETYRMILDTFNVAQEMNLDWYNITILQPLPNTPIFEEMVKLGLINTTVNFEEIRYSSGAYGKHRKMAESSRDLLCRDFKNAFKDVNLDFVPPKEHLDDLWAYMNYHLNFGRLFRENRPLKLYQQLKYVENITNLIAPTNAFAAYFLGYLQYRLYGKIDREVIEKLEHILNTDEYWVQRFDDFKLSSDHLRNCDFSMLGVVNEGMIQQRLDAVQSVSSVADTPV